MQTVKTSPETQAREFLDRCLGLGWKVAKITDSVVTITKAFEPGNRQSLVECDMEYFCILSLCPFKGGSIWGTDCGGIGAMSALQSGVFRMNKSGNSGKRFAAALAKML